MNTSISNSECQIFSCGDAALTISFSDDISLRAFERVQSVSRLFSGQQYDWVAELVSAFATLTVIVNLPSLAKHTPNPLEYVRSELLTLLRSSPPHSYSSESRTITLPVCFDAEFALDLEEIAIAKNMSKEAVCAMYCSAEYRVAMIGFTPGFPYLLGLPEELSMPRKSSPRTRVEAGSVGIAGVQTGMYSFASPGGWNIIGRTPERLFEAEKIPPTLFRAGDKVRFEAISKAEYSVIVASRSTDILVCVPNARKRIDTDDKVQNTILPDADLPDAKLRAFGRVEGTGGTVRLRGFPQVCATGGIEILESGFLTTIQDDGRIGFREYGVPQSGFADRLLGEIANMLVGNARNEAVFEVLFGKSAFRFNADAVIAICGAEARVIAEYQGASVRVPMNCAVAVRAGTQVRLEGAHNGVWSYVAVRGGLDVPLVLGSRSTYARAGLGGFEGRCLQNGDVIEYGVSVAARKRTFAFEQLFPNHSSLPAKALHHSLSFAATKLNTLIPTSPKRLRVIRGAEWGTLDSASKEALFGKPFRVLRESDKMGLRLQTIGTQGLKRGSENQLVSRAVLPGTIQLPPDGRPILLLADCQTTGGYPVIAHVCSADVPFAAQIRAGEEVVFEEISVERAQKLYIEQLQALDLLEHRLQRHVRSCGFS
ncbi:MAG: 5-oxoprolinase subunit PxpB [Candidatus Kapabacteria bacterium]|jgi:KipI family sensor histidine kinase inhibitor|nr:5-oxoprolinase subunit PxpB [Candidatus Kapabacteria bacterium]